MAKIIDDAFVAEQARRQADDPDSPAKQEVDFSAFQGGPGPARLAELSVLLAGAHVGALRQLLADGRVTAQELVYHYAARAARPEHRRLNAILELNGAALELARTLDDERAAGRLRGPLHGIPILLKDNVATGDGLHNTAGAAALQGARADRDAKLVQHLRAAGAVILGKTNLSEWANFMTSRSVNGFSALGGHTRNPHGRFDVSGSSSGSAAAVAAELAPAAVGTETAGSLVSPASQNGIATIKPSVGLVSRDRIIPISDAMDTAGPMAHRVADLALLLTIMAGADDADPATAQAAPLHGMDFTTCLALDGLQGIHIGLPAPVDEARLDNDVVTARVVARLQEAGAIVKAIPFRKPVVDYLPVFFYGLRHGVDAYLAAVAGYAPVATLADVIAYNAVDLDVRAPYGQDYLEQAQATTWTPDDYRAAVEANRALTRDALRSALREHRVDMLLSLGNQLTRLYAPAGCPAVTVPAGVRSSGEPVGMTLVGDYLDEPRLLAAAYAFEQVQAAGEGA